MRADRPIVYLDRDGTLIVEREYLSDPRKVKLLPGVSVGMRRLQKTGFPLVVVSNQAGIARGLITRAQAQAVKRRFIRDLASKGVRINGYFFCPHGPHDGCPCRKPKPGMLKQAGRKLRRSWRGGIVVGDKDIDIQLGQRSGGQGVLVLTGYGRQHLRRMARKPDHVATDFRSAVQWIIRQIEKSATESLADPPKS